MSVPESEQFDRSAPDWNEPRASGWGLPEWFAVAQVAGPAILYLPGSQLIRAPLRIGVFALSLMGLFWCLRGSRFTRAHLSWILLVIAALFMSVMLLHPATNTVMAGLAQIGMHLAIAAPLLWAPSYFVGDYRRLLRMLTILWILNGASAVVGILQVRDPGTWMPAEFSTAIQANKYKMVMYQYKTDDGSMAIRPPGLGDSPGAACGAGMFVAMTGLAFMGLPVSLVRRILGFIMGLAGIIVIFLSHVRSALIVAVGCAVIYLIILATQGRMKAALGLVVWVGLCGVCSLFYVEFAGARSTMNRFATLVADNPLTVYEKSARMGMVTETFSNTLFEFPLGAGLGRWGMMRRYFGNENNSDSPELWAEIQFAAWVFDGGIILMTLYLVAILVAITRLIRLSFMHHSNQLGQWGAVLVMLSAGPVAFLFSYCPFYSQMGMQFWLLIGAFEGLAQGEEHRSAAEDGEEDRTLLPLNSLHKYA